MRVSLKDLFGIVACSAILAWCLARVGWDNGLFWFVASITGAASAGFVYLAKDEKRRRWVPLAALGIVVVVLVTSPIVMSLALLVNAFMILVLGSLCLVFKTNRERSLYAMGVACWLSSLMVGALPGVSASRQLEAMRREFPIVSLKDRLQYEGKTRASGQLTDVVLTTPVANELNLWETEYYSYNRRHYQLKQIHDRAYENFVRAQGFGVGRMIRPNLESLRRPPLDNIAFNDLFRRETVEKMSQDWRLSTIGVGESNELPHLHKASRLDFLNPDGFGAALEPRVKVVGFIAHGFHVPPRNALKNADVWTIERLELVSLQQFPEPRVYVVDHLPRMDQLSSDKIPTRPLDAFEANGLARLRSDNDVVTEEAHGTVRMLGSLRAAKQCLDCHNVRRGELLGAFSYVIRRGNSRQDTADAE